MITQKNSFIRCFISLNNCENQQENDRVERFSVNRFGFSNTLHEPISNSSVRAFACLVSMCLFIVEFNAPKMPMPRWTYASLRLKRFCAYTHLQSTCVCMCISLRFFVVFNKIPIRVLVMQFQFGADVYAAMMNYYYNCSRWIYITKIIITIKSEQTSNISECNRKKRKK